jgi:hypothetical protein
MSGRTQFSAITLSVLLLTARRQATDGCHLYLRLLYLEIPRSLEAGNANRAKGIVAPDRW